MGKLESVNPLRPTDQAARWFLRLQENTAGPETFIEWQKWLNAAPENRLAYEEIEDTALRLGRVSVMPELPTAEDMAQDTYDGSLSIEEWKNRTSPSLSANPSLSPNIERGSTDAFGNFFRGPLLRFGLRYAVAASLAIVVVLASVLWTQRERDIQLGDFAYHTAPGQRQVVKLPDGSMVTLDADSALEVQLKSDSRALTLDRGEAFFEVAKDKTRPFIVRAGTAQVTAVGTAFNVRMSDNRTVVAVTEGKVEMESTPQAAPLLTRILTPRKAATPRLTAQVSAGEAIAYVDDGNMLALPAAEASLATAWLEGRRQYQNEPLRYVLADVNRYTGKRIEITGQAAELRFTGTLDLENSEAWLRGLPVALPVTITEKKDGTLSIQ